MFSAPVTLYTWANCPFCVRAKNLLKSKNISFEEINLDGKDEELKALRERTGFRTVPQIFVGEEFVGGFTELAALDGSGKLDEMLKR
jgi:glutaredoxin 3